MTLRPSNIQVIGDELAIAWSDGAESFLKLESLRRACPCAACGGEPDVRGYVVRPKVTHTGASYRLRNYQIVGGYAWQPTWEDGHNTGLFSFAFLKRFEKMDTSVA